MGKNKDKKTDKDKGTKTKTKTKATTDKKAHTESIHATLITDIKNELDNEDKKIGAAGLDRILNVVRREQERVSAPSKEAINLAESMTPIDSVFFRRIVLDWEAMEELASAVLGTPVTVHYAQSEVAMSNPGKRFSILDALLLISPKNQGAVYPRTTCPIRNNTWVILEVQKKTSESLEKHKGMDMQRRLRFEGALVTANHTFSGTKYADINDVIAVVISNYDILQENQITAPVYRICPSMQLSQTNRSVLNIKNNGFIDIYINMAAAVAPNDAYEEKISCLGRIFMDKVTYNESEFRAISRRKRQLLDNTGEELMEMASSIEEYGQGRFNEGREEGREEGRDEGVDGVLNLFEMLDTGTITKGEFLLQAKQLKVKKA